MKYRTSFSWMVLATCIGTSFVLGRMSSLKTTEATRAHIPLSAVTAPPTAIDGAKAFLPLVHGATEASPQSQLAATVAALVEENGQQATNIAGWDDAISYLATKVPAQATNIAGWTDVISSLATTVPAQNRVPTIDVLMYQHAQLSTQVAALYVALGSPIPTSPPTPTSGPSPLPTRTPTVLAFGLGQVPAQTPSPIP